MTDDRDDGYEATRAEWERHQRHLDALAAKVRERQERFGAAFEQAFRAAIDRDVDATEEQRMSEDRDDLGPEPQAPCGACGMAYRPCMRLGVDSYSCCRDCDHPERGAVREWWRRKADDPGAAATEKTGDE